MRLSPRSGYLIAVRPHFSATFTHPLRFDLQAPPLSAVLLPTRHFTRETSTSSHVSQHLQEEEESGRHLIDPLGYLEERFGERPTAELSFQVNLSAGSGHNATTIVQPSRRRTLGKLCLIRRCSPFEAYTPGINKSNHSTPRFSQEENNKRPTKRGPMKSKSHLRVVTAPTVDTCGTTLVLRFDTSKRRYLIGNVSEGTQRSFVAATGGLRNIQAVFMTGKLDWHSFGGFVGILLTLADQRSADQPVVKEENQNRDIPVHGPPNLKQTLATCRRFVFRKGLPVYAYEHRPNDSAERNNVREKPTWEDDLVRAWAMPIEPSRQGGFAILPENPRKRSFDQAMGWSDNLSEEQQEKRYDLIRESIVGDMFNSNWRFDALHEMKLEDVQMPAKIFIRDQTAHKIKEYTGPKPGDMPASDLPDLTVLVRRPWPAALIGNLPPTKPSLVAVSYIIRTHPVRGKFDPKKAAALGLKDKSKYKFLTAGEAVENENGEMIQPEQVLGQGNSGEAFGVIELPSIDYIDPLIARKEWSSPELLENMRNIVWILAPGVFGDHRLQDFMHKLSTDLDIHHVISSPDTHPNKVSFIGVAGHYLRLSKADPARYPGLFFDQTTIPQMSATGTTTSNSQSKDRPTFHSSVVGIDMPNGKVFDNALYDQEVRMNAEVELQGFDQSVLELSGEAVRGIEADSEALNEWKQKIPDPDTEVITLGTGSAMPSKYRNVLATLVRVPGKGAYLFDAGENTWGQIQRTFGVEGTREVMKELRLIWISHMHADHHLGITSVIRGWRDVVHGKTRDGAGGLSEQRLAVISDHHMIEWLREYAEIEDYGFSHLLPIAIAAEKPSDGTPFQPPHLRPPHLHLYSTDSKPLPYTVAALEKHTHISDVCAVAVNHCAGARAVSVSFRSGLKISYSGDCRPSEDFAKIGKGSTLLIHEATFDDDLKGDAMAKKHSTTSEALEIGEKMGAKCVLLTHFSQRYCKFPVVETDETLKSQQNSASDGLITEGPVPAGPTDAVEPTPTRINPLDPAIEGALLPDADDLLADETPSDNTIPDVPVVPSAKVFRVSDPDLKVGVAFDHMRVKLGEFAHLQYYTPALVKLFEEATEEMMENQKKKVASVEKTKLEGKGQGKKKGNGNGNGKAEGKTKQ